MKVNEDSCPHTLICVQKYFYTMHKINKCAKYQPDSFIQTRFFSISHYCAYICESESFKIDGQDWRSAFGILPHLDFHCPCMSYFSQNSPTIRDGDFCNFVNFL